MRQLSLSHKTTQEFIAYLRELCVGLELKPYYFKRQRITQIHIPILENDGNIPESMNFAQLCENLCSNFINVRIELQKYYTDFGTYQLQSPYQSKTKALNTKEMAAKTGLSQEKIRHLARHNKIRGAVKKGRYWRFFPT